MAGAPLIKKDLDGRSEDWFRAKHQLYLEFEVEDAVAKLQRLELLQCSGQGLTAHLSNKPSSSSTTSGTTSSLMLVSRQHPQHSKRRIEPAVGNIVDQQCGGSGLHPHSATGSQLTDNTV